MIANIKKQMSTSKHRRVTKQFCHVLEALQSLKHPTADEVYELVRKEMPNISLGTVYRNLEQLSSFGMIQKLKGTDRQCRFDLEIKPHDHIRCCRCGVVVDVPAVVSQKCHIAFPQVGGFNLMTYTLEFQGVCDQCQKKDKDVDVE